jgi:ectoine hydroxylase-related dioxygenase (phytanoyl-CoA dioxygenase family)
MTPVDVEVGAAYRRDGVIRCRGFFNPEEVAELRQAFDRYRSRLAELPNSDFTLEPDGRTVRNFWRMEQHDSHFAALARSPKLLRLVSPLVGGDPVVTGVESFNKPARVGTAVPPHQDNAYFCQRPPDVLSVWIALDPATAENGAVEYALGSHLEFRPHRPSGVKGNSFGLSDPAAADAFPSFLGTLDSGGILVHHCQTIHRSEPNRSDRPRLSLVIVYRGAHTEPDPEMRTAYQRALAETPQNA